MHAPHSSRRAGCCQAKEWASNREPLDVTDPYGDAALATVDGAHSRTVHSRQSLEPAESHRMLAAGSVAACSLSLLENLDLS